MNKYAISTLNFYLTELYNAFKLDDFITVNMYHGKITSYAQAMDDFGVDFEICEALCRVDTCINGNYVLKGDLYVLQ